MRVYVHIYYYDVAMLLTMLVMINMQVFVDLLLCRVVVYLNCLILF